MRMFLDLLGGYLGVIIVKLRLKDLNDAKIKKNSI